MEIVIPSDLKRGVRAFDGQKEFKYDQIMDFLLSRSDKEGNLLGMELDR